MSQFQTVDESQQDVSQSNDNAGAEIEDAIQMEHQKKLIKSHPLFVLLELLFEKCEQATQGDEAPTSASFDDDIQDFVRQKEQDMTPLLSENPEIDNLMIKAIQVLRIHLLELEKVNELCKDFCHRYITCLKGKMHSENLLRSDVGLFNEGSPPTNQQSQAMANTPNANVTVNHQGEIVRQGIYSNMLEGGVGDVTGTTPLSQVGTLNNSNALQTLSSSRGSYLQSCDEASLRKSKRGVLPKQATESLRSWLFSHIVHPYPTEDEKRALASQTNLTLLQVNNWFINARRRILQPMLDASNPDAGNARAKKQKTQSSRTPERYWPHANNTTDQLPLEDVQREWDAQ